MARSNELRPIVKMRSTAGTGTTYVIRKNRRNDPDRMTLRRYDPRGRRQRTVPTSAGWAFRGVTR